MDLRSGSSAERRRRVLREDAACGEAETPAPRRRTRVRIDAAHYPEAAQPHRQPRVVDLVPVKWWSLALALGIGGSLAAAVLVGFAYFRALAAALGEETLRPLDLARRGNLADWLSSWTLLATALVAGIVYLLRRHRVDDYRGRYRAWPWTAGAIALGAVDAAAGLNQFVAGSCVALTGLAVYGGGAFWWILVEGLLLLAVSAALVREYVRCRVSLAALALALLAYAGMAAAAVVRVDVASGPASLIAQEGFRLFGHLFLAGSVLIYARHVLREVQGLQKSARKKRKAQADAGEPRVPAPHFQAKRGKSRERSAAPPAAATATPKPAASASSAAPSAATSPGRAAPAAPTKPEPNRTAPTATVAAKPASDANRSPEARPGETRRTDPPAKPSGPLASKLRPPGNRATATVAQGSSGDDEDDDDRRSRKQKKRR